MRKLPTTIGAAAALGLLTTGAVSLPAQADTITPVTVHVKNHADNGHGDPSHWANDAWDRTSTITASGDGTYTVKLSGTGDFTTIADAGSPSGATGVQVGNEVTGKFSESLTATVTGTPKTNAQLDRIDGNSYDDAGGAAYSTSAWIKHLFKSASNPTVTTESYRYEYVRPCESWVDSSGNNDGRGESAGNITGKTCTPAFVPSVLKAANKCRVSRSDKRNWWNVSNVQGPRARTFWLHVSYSGKTTYEGRHSVGAGDTAPVRTSHGGKLTVGYYDGQGHHKYAYAWSNAGKLCG